MEIPGGDRRISSINSINSSVDAEAVLELSGSDRTLVRMLCKQLLGPQAKVKVVGC